MKIKSLLSLLGLGMIFLLLTACSSTTKDLTITFQGDTCSYNGPNKLPAGEVNVTMDVKDINRDSYFLAILTLDKGKTVEDLRALSSTDKPSWADIVYWSEIGKSGQKNQFPITVSEGPIFFVCFSKPPEALIGALGPVEITK